MAGTSSSWLAPTGASDAALMRALVGRWSIPFGAQGTVFFEIVELRSDGTFDAEWAWERFDVALRGRWEAHAGMLFFTLSDGSVLPPMRAERTADRLRLSDPSSRLVSELRSSPDFACGPALQCDPASSYCLRVLTDVAGNGDDYFCEPLPRECRSCDCVARGGARCAGTPLGGIRVTRPGG